MCTLTVVRGRIKPYSVRRCLGGHLHTELRRGWPALPPSGQIQHKLSGTPLCVLHAGELDPRYLKKKTPKVYRKCSQVLAIFFIDISTGIDKKTLAKRVGYGKLIWPLWRTVLDKSVGGKCTRLSVSIFM